MHLLFALWSVLTVQCMWIPESESKSFMRTDREALARAGFPTTTSRRANCTNCNDRTPRNAPPDNPPSPVSLQEQQSFRIQLIKQEILTKLGRSRPPTINSTIPRDMLRRAIQTLDMRPVKRSSADGLDNVDISEIITFSENAVNTSSNEALRFSIDAQRPKGSFEVTNAHIYVLAQYRRKKSPAKSKRKRQRKPSRRLSVQVFHADPKTGNEKRVSLAQISIRHTRWLKITFPTSLLQNVFDNRGRFIQMRLVCDSCGRGVNLVMARKSRQSKRVRQGARPRKRRKAKMNKRRPYMVIKTKTVRVAPKKRRATECDEQQTTCCKRSIEVRFSDIGWDDWIIAPTVYKANYCDGECTRLSPNPATYSAHRTVMDIYQRGNPNFSLNLCCTPRRWSSLSMLFYDDNSNIIQKNLDKMIVEECGCS